MELLYAVCTRECGRGGGVEVLLLVVVVAAAVVEVSRDTSGGLGYLPNALLRSTSQPSPGAGRRLRAVWWATAALRWENAADHCRKKNLAKASGRSWGFRGLPGFVGELCMDLSDGNRKTLLISENNKVWGNRFNPPTWFYFNTFTRFIYLKESGAVKHGCFNLLFLCMCFIVRSYI